MIEIRVTGGFSDHVHGEITEQKKATLIGATIKFALVPEGDDPPAAGHASWKSSSMTLVINPVYVARGTYLINDQTGLGSYYLWGLVEKDGTATPVQARDDLIVVY